MKAQQDHKPNLIGKLRLLQTYALIAEPNSVFRSELSQRLSKKYLILNQSSSQNTELRITVVPVANDSDCPSEGRFGNNTIAQTTLLKYEDRLPHRKIREALRRMHGLDISPA